MIWLGPRIRSGRHCLAKNVGNLYTVELLPDESEFLDWDKPISEQSNPKLAALRKAHRAFLADPAQRISDKGKNGDSLYHMLERQKGSAKAASEYLASIGIPGIKYLDGNKPRQRQRNRVTTSSSTRTL